jgi:hypothetical protein
MPNTKEPEAMIDGELQVIRLDDRRVFIGEHDGSRETR